MNKQQQIDQIVETFRKLYEEQLDRADNLGKLPAVDFTARPLTIGVAGGDGIGPIITQVARQVLEMLLGDDISKGDIVLKDIEGLTIENRLARDESIPADVMAQLKECPVLLKGPTTTPNGGTMTSANVTLRRALDLFANVRPVSLPELDIDWVFFRENTEGEYTLGSRGVDIPGVMAMDFKVITVEGTRRIAKAAFDFARNTGKTRVTIVTKANIMKKTDGLFSDICHEVAKDYPEIQVDEYYVDIMTANLINPSMQKQFQVILTPNLYGDILTDEAAQLQGGVGTAGSANLGARYAMFEAIHGSAPRMMEEGLGDWANPESILQAAALLLKHIGCADKANKLINAIIAVKEQGVVVNGTPNGASCQQFGDALIQYLS